MSIHLFKHNQEAYNSVTAMLEREKMAAVIHPTGTGKSLIAFKLAEEHPSEKFLYNSEMFKSVFKYSMPLVPNQLSWWVVGASDRTIVSHFISVFENGIYSVANKFSTIYVTFYNIFNLSWTESVSLHMNDGDRDDFLTDIINTMFNLFAAVDVGIIACIQ